MSADLQVISALALQWAGANWMPVAVLIISLAAVSILAPRAWRQLGARDPRPDTGPLPDLEALIRQALRDELIQHGLEPPGDKETSCP
jgi:hypothetical protein